MDGSKTPNISLNKILKKVFYSLVSKSFTERNKHAGQKNKFKSYSIFFCFGNCNRPDAIKKIRGKKVIQTNHS